MKKKPIKKSKYNEDIEIDIQACSTTDCTGLIPTLPQSESEVESYKSIIDYQAHSIKTKR